MRLGSVAAYTPALLACYATSFVVHIASVTLTTVLPCPRRYRRSVPGLSLTGREASR